MLKSLLAEIESYSEGRKIEDDMTIIVFEYKGHPTVNGEIET